MRYPEEDAVRRFVNAHPEAGAYYRDMKQPERQYWRRRYTRAKKRVVKVTHSTPNREFPIV